MHNTETRVYWLSVRNAAATILAGLLASAAGLCAVILVGAAPRDPGEIAAVFPPWWPAERALYAAGTAGAVTRTGGLGSIIVTRGDPTTLAGRLRKAGALLLLDPVGAGLCAAPKASRL